MPEKGFRCKACGKGLRLVRTTAEDGAITRQRRCDDCQKTHSTTEILTAHLSELRRDREALHHVKALFATLLDGPPNRN